MPAVVPPPCRPAALPQPVSWSLIVEPEGRPGSEQMATDAALLAAACDGTAFLRLYRWSPGCLSFGRNEPALERYDRSRIDALGLDTVRRPTGGRAVWHEAEVTYAVAGPDGMFGSLPETYRAIHAMMADGLRALGVPAELAAASPAHPLTRSPAGLAAGACFASPAGGEVMARGAKLAGSAQVREHGAFLQHGSILLEDGQDLVARVTRGPAPLSGATSLVAVLGRRVTFAEVAAALTGAARRAWPGDWRDEPAPPPADSGRFADPAWTWRR
jgi:lipoate-protein ligase A